MTATTYILIALLAMCASFIQRMTGFGFGIFIMTVLPFLMPTYAEATALSSMMALVTALTTSIQMFRYIDWKKMWLILLVFLVCSFIAIRMVAGFDSHLLRRILGGALIVFSFNSIFSGKKIRLRPSVPVQAGMGALSGFTGGLFSIQGPPAVIYFLACTDSKEQYMALISMYLLITNSAMTLFRAGNGFVTAAVGKVWLFSLPAIFLGIWIGTKVCNKISAPVLRNVIYAYIGLAGIQALVF